MRTTRVWRCLPSPVPPLASLPGQPQGARRAGTRQLSSTHQGVAVLRAARLGGRRTIGMEVHDLVAGARLGAQNAHLLVQAVPLDLRGSNTPKESTQCSAHKEGSRGKGGARLGRLGAVRQCCWRWRRQWASVPDK